MIQHLHYLLLPSPHSLICWISHAIPFEGAGVQGICWED